MKNIFIAGVAKSGKSTIAKILNKNGEYNHIPMDYFASSLKHNFPDTKITSNVVIDKVSSKNLALLLSRVIQIINTTDEKFIIDSAHIMPQDIIKYLDRDKWDVYYVGYPSVTAKEKLQLIRKYEKKEDWTSKKEDEELLETLQKLVDISIQMKNECEKLNITFIDTGKEMDSNEFEKSVLNDFRGD